MATILIADDRPMNRQYLVSLLGYFGHRLVEASDGVEALKLARAEHPGLVISDLIMPGMDGQELASRLRADPELADIPVLFYSAAYSTRQAEALARAAGALGVLPKPSDPETILETVNTALGLPSTSPTTAKKTGVPPPVLPAVARLPREFADLEAISYRLAALIEMSLELAAERNPGQLLQGLAHMTRKLIGAKYAAVGLLSEDGHTIRVFHSSGAVAANATGEIAERAAASAPRAAASPPHDSTLGRLIEDRRPLRLRNVEIAQLGVEIPLAPGVSKLESILAIPFAPLPGRQGWLLLADKLGGEGFSDEDGRVASTLASQGAVTYERLEERRRADADLHKTKAMFENVFESAPDGLLATDSDGRITHVNTQVEKLFGYSRAELVGQLIEILVPGRFQERHSRHRLVYGAEPRLRPMGARLDTYGRRKDGAEFPADIMLSPMDAPEGKRVLSVVRDITTRKQAEERIQELNRQLEARVEELQVANHALEAFTYSVSHDLRAPLRHIAGFSKIVCEEAGPRLDPSSRGYLKQIEESTRHMGRLIDELLNLSRVDRQNLERRPTPLNSLVEEVVRELQRECNGREIEWRISRLPVVECDPGLMRLVFTNLLSNALKFSRGRQRAVVEVSQVSLEDQTAVLVRDNGVGFDMKYADKLFGPFQRLHRAEQFEGTGVGLATVQRIIHRHGGRVWADAELNKGATFYFTLPELSGVAVGNAAPTAGTDCREDVELLLVEDNAADEALALHELHRHEPGLRVQVAHDGEQALEFVFSRGSYSDRSGKNPPALILLDLDLPKVSGKEVLRAIRIDARTQRIPVVILTSSKALEDLPISLRPDGGCYCIHKPLRIEQFRQAITMLGIQGLLVGESQAAGKLLSAERSGRQ